MTESSRGGAALLHDLEELLTGFQQAAEHEAWELLPALDARLRSLLDANILRSIASHNDLERDRLITKLDQLNTIHRKIITAATEQQRVIAEALQQLRHDQQAASAYVHVRRQSF